MQRCILDIETNSLTNVTKIWLIGILDVETKEKFIFERPDLKPEAFLKKIAEYDLIIGHNIIDYDYFVLLLFFPNLFPYKKLIDTLVISRLLYYQLEGGHSLEAWGQRLGLHKLNLKEFNDYSEEMVPYLERDLEVNLKLFKKFEPIIYQDQWRQALRTEHDMAYICRDMRNNGFGFNIFEAKKLYRQIMDKLKELDNDILRDFPGKYTAIKEITPKLTKHGTLSLSDFRWEDLNNLSNYSEGASFTRIEFEPFNPNSTKQIIDHLDRIGWNPTEKTKGHIQAEKDRDKEKLEKYKKYGWKVNEKNLETVSKEAPESTRKLVQRLLYDARRSTLEEWLNAYSEHSRAIHGHINSIGTWTHRASHTNPNMGNIPAKDKPLAKELRSLWQAKEDRLLIGVDAESIQLRIFAHYINDPVFTESLLTGKKEDGTDPHSLNKQTLGIVCKSRDDAKTFLYAFLLGVGVKKASQILKCTVDEAQEAMYNFINRYTGLRDLKESQIPFDAKRGFFEGFDGRRVLCDNPHLILAGYLQNGEQAIMKKANIIWREQLDKEKIPYWQVDWVHDEWQTETINNIELANYIADVQCNSIKLAGESYNLNCPMMGSKLNKYGKVAIGHNWSETH